MANVVLQHHGRSRLEGCRQGFPRRGSILWFGFVAVDISPDLPGGWSGFFCWQFRLGQDGSKLPEFWFRASAGGPYG